MQATQRKRGVLNTRFLPMYILLFVPCFKWLFESIVGSVPLELLILLAGIMVLFTNKRRNSLRKGGVWLIYLAAIAMSVALHSRSMRILYSLVMVAEIIVYEICMDYDLSDYQVGLNLLFRMALLNAVFVMLHYFMKSGWNNLYFRFLNAGSESSAMNYYRRGYYFGFFITPADPAGLMMFAIVMCAIRLSARGKKRVSITGTVLLIAFLAVGLFMTGKKGVLLFGAIAMLFMFMVLYGSRRHWFRVLGVFAVFILAYAFIRYMMAAHPEIALFRRLNEFIANLSEGGNYDSGRTALYGYAIEQWNRNRLLGIGWRRFRDLTTSLYGYYYAHEVNMDYLQFLCETGVVGTVMIMIPIVASLIRTIYVCRKIVRKVTDPAALRVLLFAIFIQFYIVMYAMVEVPFYDMFFFSTYMFSCCVINSAMKQYQSLAVG